jgi:plasmid stability protein
MPNLSVKDVPESLAEALRQRAARNHRSLQGELMALLEASVAQSSTQAAPVPRVNEPAPVALRAAEPTLSAYFAAGANPVPLADQDDLLARLDAIVAGSQWGHAPLLTREQTHDRRLARELDYEERRGEAA